MGASSTPSGRASSSGGCTEALALGHQPSEVSTFIREPRSLWSQPALMQRAWDGILVSVNIWFGEQVVTTGCRAQDGSQGPVALPRLCGAGLMLSPSPLPVHSCKGQPSQKRRKEENYTMEFCSFSAASLQLQRLLLCKNKKKKKSLSSAKIFTYHIWKGTIYYTFWNALKIGIKESEAH